MLLPATLFTALIGDPALANGWSRIAMPTRGAPHSIGQTSNGCLAGAQALPLDGAGYMVMHIERNRYYGHPALVRMVQSLGGRVAQEGIGKLQVGDLSQPRGGPMPTGHRSHQSGLDVDIWFNLDPKLYLRTNALRANLSAPSMLNSSRNGLDRSLWTNRHIRLLELAANQPEVDRIFVNPYIKLDLCGKAHGDRGWLRKIRPWYGHDDHFHIRLSCPPGSAECEQQDPIPLGEGCDASLDWWLEQPLPPKKPQPVPILPMPAQCRAILGAP